MYWKKRAKDILIDLEERGLELNYIMTSQSMLDDIIDCTFVEDDDIKKLKEEGKIFQCLCYEGVPEMDNLDIWSRKELKGSVMIGIPKE